MLSKAGPGGADAIGSQSLVRHYPNDIWVEAARAANLPLVRRRVRADRKHAVKKKRSAITETCTARHKGFNHKTDYRSLHLNDG